MDNAGGNWGRPGSVVAVEGHPDDVELSCLGTLILLGEQGWRITIVSITDGSNGAAHDAGMTGQTITQVRFEEARSVAQDLGGEFRCLEAKDGYAYDTPEMRGRLAGVLRDVGADLVLAPPPNDYHYDHITASELAFSAAYYSKSDMTITPEIAGTDASPLKRVPALYYYDANAGVDFVPSFCIDISQYIERKKELVARHVSQMSNMKALGGWDLVDYVEIVGRFRGLQASTTYAEAFQSCRRWPRNPALERFPR